MKIQHLPQVIVILALLLISVPPAAPAAAVFDQMRPEGLALFKAAVLWAVSPPE